MTIKEEIKKKKKVDFLMTIPSCPASTAPSKDEVITSVLSSSNKQCSVTSNEALPVNAGPTESLCEHDKQRENVDDKIPTNCMPQNPSRRCQAKKSHVSSTKKKVFLKNKLLSEEVERDEVVNRPLIPCHASSCHVQTSCKSIETKILNSVRVTANDVDIQTNHHQEVTSSSSKLRYQHQLYCSPTTESNYSKIQMPSRFPSGSSLNPCDYCFYLRHHTLPVKDSSSSDASSSDSDTDVKRLRSSSKNAFPGSLCAASKDVPQVSELLTNLIQDMKELSG